MTVGKIRRGKEDRRKGVKDSEKSSDNQSIVSFANSQTFRALKQNQVDVLSNSSGRIRRGKDMRKSSIVAPIAANNIKYLKHEESHDDPEGSALNRRGSPRQENVTTGRPRLISHTFDPNEVLFQESAIDNQSKIESEKDKPAIVVECSFSFDLEQPREDL